MKKLLFILLLFPVSLMAQSYPKAIVLNNDTLILITPIQLKKANIIFIQKDYYQKLSVNYDSTIQLYKRREANWKRMDKEYMKTETLLKTQLSALKGQKDIQKEHYDLLLKKEKKKRVRSIVVFSLIGVIVGVAIALH